MSYPFDNLKGRRILLDKPERPKSAIELTPETAAKLDEEFAKKWNKLKVYAVGEDVESWKVGEFVFVPGHVLQHAEAVDVEGSVKIMVGEHDIAFRWKEGPKEVSNVSLLR
jgi:hypothetical protein